MISLATMILRSIAAMNILLLFVLVILAPTFVSALAPSTDNNYTLLPPPPRVIPPLTKPSAVTRVTIEGGAVVSVHFYFQPNETYYAIYFDPHHDPRKKGLQPQPICFALALGLPKLGDDSFSPGGCFFRGMPDSIQCLTQNMNESNPCSRKKQHTIESGKRDYFLKNPKACGVDYVDIGMWFNPAKLGWTSLNASKPIAIFRSQRGEGYFNTSSMLISYAFKMPFPMSSWRCANINTDPRSLALLKKPRRGPSARKVLAMAGLAVAGFVAYRRWGRRVVARVVP